MENILVNVNTVVNMLLRLPSVSTAVFDGSYTEKQIRDEFTDQILSGDYEHGILYLEDVTQDIIDSIIQITG